MARYTGPKHKLARREGINIFGKTSPSLDRRIGILPGAMPGKRPRKTSEYGLQLREKQKLKRIYGLLEKQFKGYVELAQSKKMNTEEALVEILESRLDNLVYRMGFANSRNHARQLVSHRHVLVDGKRNNIPSYLVKLGQEVTLSKKMLEEVHIKEQLEKEENPLLPFVNQKKGVGKYVSMPKMEDIANPIDYQLVIEFYSR
jgi:small subunit ribosomal protein S4